MKDAQSGLATTDRPSRPLTLFPAISLNLQSTGANRSGNRFALIALKRIRFTRIPVISTKSQWLGVSGRCRPFTLIELLVVVVIIAILASFLLPSLQQAKLKAKSITCMNQMRQVGIVYTMYKSDFEDWVPVYATGPAEGQWYGVLSLYRGNATYFDPLYACPGSSRGDQVSMGGVFSECHNYKTWKFGVFQNNWNDWNHFWPGGDNRGWRDPANSFYIADTFLINSATPPSLGDIYPTPDDNGNSIFVPSPHYHKTTPGTIGGWQRRFADRHLGTNGLFHDGRVESWHTIDLDNQAAGAVGTVWDTH